MESITDIPLYDVIQEIEEKHGHDVYMVIEAMLPESRTEDDYNNADIPVSEIMWWCEFQDKTKVFDNIAAVKHWFLNEVEVDPALKEMDEMGDRCFHYSDGSIVRNEEGQVIHEYDEYYAYRERNPEKFEV